MLQAWNLDEWSGSGTVQQFRNLRTRLDAALPPSALPTRGLLKKLRTDFAEFCAYLPITADGIEWGRWLFTNRFNVGNVGATRLILTTLAKLYDTTIAAAAAANQSTGTQGQAAIVTKGTAARDSRAGTWVGPATISGVTDIIYSITIGDLAIYTLIGVNRIVLRSFNTSNGGIARITVKQAGVEITSGYTIPDAGSGVRLINYVTGAVGLQHMVVADGLATATYTVELEVHSTNPLNGRLYDGGVFGYATIAFNSAGRHGIFSDVSSGGNTYKTSYFSGSRSVYQITGTTRISWRHGKVANAGKMDVRVYDSVGAEIPAASYAIVGNEIDTYSSATLAVHTTLVATGLALGTYYLHVQTKPTRHASATGYRQYDFGNMAATASAGVAGTDTFDDQGVPTALVSVTTDIPNGTMFIGTGNCEHAIKVRRTTDAAGVQDFVGGTHGRESVPASMVVKVDGAVIDYAGAAALVEWTFATLEISFTTKLKYLTGTDEWADMAFVYTLSPSGYSAQVTRTARLPAVVTDDYSLMLPVPNSASIGVYAGKGCGGPFTSWAIDGDANYTFASNNNAQTTIDPACKGAVGWNTSYGVSGVNADSATDASADPGAAATPLSLMQDRSDGVAKFYNRAFRYDATAGKTLAIGDSNTHTNFYRVVKSPDLAALMA